MLLRQPGPVDPRRFDCVRGDAEAFKYSLKPGVTLNEAITAPLVEAGFTCAAVTFCGTELGPFRYVIPARADDDAHVAYFSAPRAPEGVTRIEQACATFGWSGGKPFIHCHAVWVEPDGRRGGGHILPLESFVAAPGLATAWGFRDVRIEAQADAETNFPLFHPSGSASGRGLVARIKPNEDILVAIETIVGEQGVRDAVVRGSLGSLIGARFLHGGGVDDVATEVLVREGFIRDGVASLSLSVVDMRGEVHEGWLQRGENPVCITFELVMETLPTR